MCLCPGSMPVAVLPKAAGRNARAVRRWGSTQAVLVSLMQKFLVFFIVISKGFGRIVLGP